MRQAASGLRQILRVLGLVVLTASVPGPGTAQQPAPRVFVLRADALQEARQRLRAGDDSLRPALEQLLADADEALRAGPFSVTDKQRVPPSGDRHDYLSFGPYWWPDPSKPDGLPYIRRDGEVNPESRRDSDSPRLKQMTEAVETLALAYHFSDDERYAAHAARLLRTWFLDPATRMNPHLRYGQAIPGRVEGRGIGIIDTRILADVVDAVGLIQRSAHWSAADQQGMERWARAYLDWLTTSEHGIDEREYFNNHGTWWDVQAASLALFVGDTALAAEILRESVPRRIASHFEPDGRQPHELERTRSLSYSTMNLEGFARLAEMGRHVGVDLWSHRTDDGRGIRAGLDFIAPYADPGRTWPYPQITPVEPSSLLRHLQRARLVLRDPKYADLAERLPPNVVARDRSRLLYPDPSR